MTDLNSKIKKLIETSAKKQWPSFSIFDFLVERPKDTSHGDYSTNIALVLSKQLKKNPLEVAQEIAEGINDSLFEKVQAVAPGFINFYLSKEVLIANIKEILKNKKDFGKNQSLKNQKVIVEYTDPNILKDFHIGHLMSNAIGESIARIFQFQGAKVKRANYYGDVGMHIAKAIWGKVKNPKGNWQESYVLGAKEYEENEAVKKEIQALNKKIYEKTDKQVNQLHSEGNKESLEKFEAIYQILGTKFDYYFPESQVFAMGKKMVQEGFKKGTFEEGLPAQAGENAPIIFKGEKFGLHTRVFINSEGLPTYEAKDLALPSLKYKKFAYDLSVIITASEQNTYFDVMLAALAQINPKLAQKTLHLGHGMMKLPEGKMSSRTGKIITFRSLLEEVKKMVLERITGRDFSEKEKQEVAQQVAIGALKYSILRQSVGSDIIYDFEKSISFEGDSGPYLQYSFARAKSLLEKAKTEKIKASLNNVPTQVAGLEKLMQHFPEIVQKAGTQYQSHIIVLYLTELAREFNNYYSQHKIVDREDEFSPYKLALTEAFSIIMKNGLWLLGIQAPEKM